MVLLPALSFVYFVDYETISIVATDTYLPLILLYVLDNIALGNRVLYLATIVAFLMWTYRAARNVLALGVTDLETSPGWAVGWYFVPIANLWKPYQAAIQIWQASNQPADPSLAKHRPYLSLWWATSALGVVVSTITLRIVTVDPDAFFLESTVIAADWFLSTLSLLLTIRFVRETTYAQTNDHTAGVFA